MHGGAGNGKKRKVWTEKITEYPPEKLVYLDESEVNTDMTRIYGRAMGGARVVDNAPIYFRIRLLVALMFFCGEFCGLRLYSLWYVSYI